MGWIGGKHFESRPAEVLSADDGLALNQCQDLPTLFRAEHTGGGREVLATASADVSGDGFPDAVFVSQQDQILHVFKGGPEASLTEEHTIQIGRSAHSPVLMDMDSDGRQEMVVSVRDDSELEMVWLDSELSVQRRERVSQDVPLDMPAVADIDGDGRTDLLGVVDNGKELVWRRNHSDGMLEEQVPLVTNTRFHALSFPDAIIEDAAGFRWVEITDGHHVQTVRSLPQGARLFEVAGVASVILMSSEGKGIRILKSGARCTHPWVTQAASETFSDHVVADWNADGFLDLIRAQSCRGCTSDLSVSVGLD
ncbi:MAG TPA: hypothetical protein DFR83_12600 [Deltaproteobacteria bacterium]|nr:hypothetical protein [Deltaproteobacteria bacterium]